jgi:hypothetical protein
MKASECFIVLATAISCLLVTMYAFGRPTTPSDAYNNCRDGVVQSLTQQPNNEPVIPIVPVHPELMEYFDLIKRIRELQRNYKEQIIKLSCSAELEHQRLSNDPHILMGMEKLRSMYDELFEHHHFVWNLLVDSQSIAVPANNKYD